jgi:hypothetical protein
VSAAAPAILEEFSEFLLQRGGLSLKETADFLEAAPAELRTSVIAEALEQTRDLPWVPNPGPQFEAYYSLADEVGFGGEAGGGKSDLAPGLSCTAHRRSLILRRTNKEADKMVERFVEILGTRSGWNGQENVWRRPDGRIIDIGGCQNEDDKQKYKGNPHDLIFFDQLEDFTKNQYEFIIAWNRSTDAKQRCRVVNTFNPPTTAEGMWVLDRYAAWLDPRHPNPAKSGELRWYTRGPNGEDLEVPGAGPHMIGGEAVFAKSRTFIRATLSDNPELEQTGYGATLAALPTEYRDAYKGGKFEASLRDRVNQAIPLAWIREAQARWTPKPANGVPMCAIGVDASGGGSDPMVLAIRHDGWYAPMVEVPAKDIPQERAGAYAAGVVTSYRRDKAGVIVDLGGGYGGSIYERLIENEIDTRGFKGAAASTRRTHDGLLGFKNRRTEAYWRFREALDPDQKGGSPIMLPDDRHLVADLTAPGFREHGQVLELEPKDDVMKRLGRSPDRGDATVMAWAYGPTYLTDGDNWRKQAEERARARGFRGKPQVVMSQRQAARRR